MRDEFRMKRESGLRGARTEPGDAGASKRPDRREYTKAGALMPPPRRCSADAVRGCCSPKCEREVDPVVSVARPPAVRATSQATEAIAARPDAPGHTAKKSRCGLPGTASCMRAL